MITQGSSTGRGGLPRRRSWSATARQTEHFGPAGLPLYGCVAGPRDPRRGREVLTTESLVSTCPLLHGSPQDRSYVWSIGTPPLLWSAQFGVASITVRRSAPHCARAGASSRSASGGAAPLLSSEDTDRGRPDAFQIRCETRKLIAVCVCSVAQRIRPEESYFRDRRSAC